MGAGSGYAAPPVNLGSYLPVIVLLALAAFAVYQTYFSEEAKIRRTLKEPRAVPIAEAQAGQVVKIAGRVQPIGEPLRGPLSGRACVFFEVTVEEYRSSGKSGHWEEIIRETDAADFLVDDGTGRALVKTNAMKVFLVKDTELKSGFRDDAKSEMEAFLARHGQKSEDALFNNMAVFNRTLRCKEGVFEPGERVAVLGQAKWEQDPDPQDAGSGYRDVPKRLVMSAPDDGRRLLASDEPQMT